MCTFAAESCKGIEMTNEIVLYQPDNSIQLEVRVQDETVWLSQQQMAMLFDTTRNNITLHIGNIFKEGELEQNSVCKESLLTAADGKMYRTKFYNLDVIISVGYRVKSKRGTQFRQWANKILKDYLLRGYAVNQQLLHLEERIDHRFQSIEQRVAKTEEQVDFFVRTSLPPVEQVFYNGEFFEARVLLERIIKTAQKRVIIIDAYVDAATFEMLDVRAKGVQATIYSGKDLSSLRDLHNAKNGVEPIATVAWRQPSHDRWLIIDDKVYHCGHSLKDMGQKLSAMSLLGIDAEDVIKQVK